MKKKTVAFVISNLNAGGAQRVISSLVNNLISDYHITIISLYECNPFYIMDERVKILFCSNNYNNTPNAFQSIFNHIKLFDKMRSFIKSEHADIIIGFMTTSSIYVSLASKMLGIPSIISERNNPESSDNSSFWIKMRKWSYPFASLLVLQTEAAVSYFKKNVRKDQLIIIRNPIGSDLKLARDFTQKKENIILNVGRLISLKNQDLLIRAFSKIKSDDWKLIFIGDGDKRDDYENLVRTLGIQNKVEFTGNISNVADYYNRSKVFVFTSKSEGFPNALIEALYFGLACISTDCPSGPSELITDNENGFLIPVGDEDALQNKLQLLIDDEDMRQQFVESSKNRILEFEPNVIVNKWKAQIDKLIQQK